jgi:hypothetical protein
MLPLGSFALRFTPLRPLSGLPVGISSNRASPQAVGAPDNI